MRTWLMAVWLGLFPVLGFAQEQVVVTDADIAAGDSVVWTADHEYILDGLVYAEEGARLYIEAGTVIKARQNPTTGDRTSALIITQGAKIYAMGTPARPVIFTAESDDLNDPADLGIDDRGLWGGLILLGRARINTASGVGQIEGIDPNEPRGAYGGTDDHDSSGELHYVSIRHGGSELAPGDEINGLTMGAVGDGTKVDHVEIISNLDDGVEFFGGTVNIKYLVSAFNADDGIDYDQGFRGKGQYWFVLQAADFAGRCAEQDGGTDPEDGKPYAVPVIANATYIGPGTAVFPQGDGGELMIFRDNAGGKYYNSIFTEYNGAKGGVGIKIEDLSSGQDSRQRLESGDLSLVNNIWWNFAAGNDWPHISPQDFVRSYLTDHQNRIVDPQLAGISRSLDGKLDPRPNPDGPAAAGAVAVPDSFFDSVDFLGAFDPNAPLWLKGWTALSAYGILTGVADRRGGTKTVLEAPGLLRNYPNPFNPGTTVVYSVEQRGHVTLSVYNPLGQRVALLVDKEQAAGRYAVQWNAADQPAGIYFSRLITPSSAKTGKMILSK